MASERHRHREVRRYYQSWLLSSIGFDNDPAPESTKYHADGSQLRTSRDKSLTAFAQLGCLRLNVKRGLVTLISTDTQYILAEATRTLSLVSGTTSDAADDEIWFGNASLPRGQGVSAAALNPDAYLATDSDGSTFRAPALVIEDISQHPQYASRGYAGSGVSFYCGVPIVTVTGATIGVYTLTDDRPRHGLTATELRFMCDMATTVMRHLESVKNEAARYRGETMVLGLGRFAGGAATLHEEDAAPAPTTAIHDFGDSLKSNKSVSSSKGLTVTAADPSKLQPILATTKHVSTGVKRSSVSLDDSPPPSKKVDVGHQHTSGVAAIADHPETSQMRRSSVVIEPRKSFTESTDRVFARAANILRECAVADGVLFFDATSANLAEASLTSRLRNISPLSNPKRGFESSSTAPMSRSNHIAPGSTEDSALRSASSDDSDASTTKQVRKKTCRLLGCSIDSTVLPSTGAASTDSLWISERGIARLIRLYPKGKLFQFLPDGIPSSSDDGLTTTDVVSDARSVKVPTVAAVSTTTSSLRFRDDDASMNAGASGKSQRTSAAIAAELIRIAPDSRSIMWLPMWDFVKQRWSAGCFLWSRRPEALITVQDDLVYLKTFANSIMMEVAMVDTHIADLAKSTFVANISHELRSPLHGILGNLEILKDTNMDHFQNSLIASMEICGKNLAETIDHVLDFAKINHLSRQSRRDGDLKTLSRQKSSTSRDKRRQTGNIESIFDLAELVEEVTETVCASYAFKPRDMTSFSHNAFSPSQVHADNTSSWTPSENVTVILDIEHRTDWTVCSEPGAVRRILANLLGNSLKYTQSGTIRVALSGSQNTNGGAGASNSSLAISVTDTGKGMSKDFARNHAFTPFTQESSFSVGTGLGLSIVQQLVNSLGGTVQLDSEEGVGTSVSVLLNLVHGYPTSLVDTSATVVNPGLATSSFPGKSICIIDPSTDSLNPSNPHAKAFHQSLEKMILDWSQLDTVSAKDLVNRQVDLVIYTKCPSVEHLQSRRLLTEENRPALIIVVVANALEKASLMRQSALIACLGSRFDVITYPIGPQKLSKSIFRLLGSTAEPKQLISDQIPSRPASQISLRQKDQSKPLSQNLDSLEVATSHAAATRNPTEPSTYSEETSDSRPAPRHGYGPNIAQSSSTSRVDHQRRTTSTSKSKTGTLSDRPPSMSDEAIPTRTGGHDGLHVLLVDDNEINLNILKACMKRAKVSFEAAKNGLEAVQAFRANIDSALAFTHVLMDISMPVMDGIEATRRIRDTEHTHRKRRRRRSTYGRDDSNVASENIPSHPVADMSVEGDPQLEDMALKVAEKGDWEGAGDERSGRVMIIALSGVASEQAQEEMYGAGADMFLPKPINMKRLVETIKA